MSRRFLYTSVLTRTIPAMIGSWLIACNDAPTAATPEDSTPIVTVTPSVLRHVTDSATIDVMVNGTKTQITSLSVASETRDISDLPVLSAVALNRHVLIPVAPGSVQLAVRTAKAAPETVTVDVVFDQPAVLAATSTAPSRARR